MRPLRAMRHERYTHVAVRGLEITLCSRVRPGDKVEEPGEVCPRCDSRLRELY